ncbi:hypothetical protein AB205_0123620, partial [Aquarana catesbeiana]
MRNLWEVKNTLYYNKQARRSTLEKLLEFVKTRVPDATIQFLESKIGILRNMYKKEHKKIQKSLRSGASAAQVYVHRLWYFNKLRFLDDQTEPRESLSTLPCSLPSTLSSTPAEADEEQPGPSILEEVDAPRWNQDELSQEEGLESGSQEVAMPSVSQEVAVPRDSQETGGPVSAR